MDDSYLESDLDYLLVQMIMLVQKQMKPLGEEDDMSIIIASLKCLPYEVKRHLVNGHNKLKVMEAKKIRKALNRK